MKTVLSTLVTLVIFLFPPLYSLAQCGTCDYTEANLAGTSPIDIIPAGKTLCITTNYCLGASSNWPGPTCGNINSGHLTINGTLRICSGVRFKFDGTINGSGNIDILTGGRFSLYGTYDCNVHLSAIDPSLLNGQTSNSTTIGGCNDASCEPKFSNGYAPFGVIATGLGYTVNNGSCTITGKSNLIVLAIQSLNLGLSWQDKDIRIDWTNDSPDPGIEYTIDYSADGTTWQTITNIPSTGQGMHSYLAKGPFNPKNFFRFRATTSDGQTSYSPVKELNAQPVEHYTEQIFDITGKPVKQMTTGTYILITIKPDGSRSIKKITRLQ